MRGLRLTTAAFVGVLLGGCMAVSYPDLYTPPLPNHLKSSSTYQERPRGSGLGTRARSVGNAPVQAAPTGTVVEDDGTTRDLRSLEQVVIAAHDSQKRYADGYQESARQLDESQIPLIAAAGIAALVLYNNPANASDYLAGLGVGSAFYSTTRSTLLPRRMPELYILGHSALGCIRAETPYFLGEDADEAWGGLLEATAAFDSALTGSRQEFATAQLGEPASPEQRTAFQTAMTGLNEAIVAGTATLNASNRQAQAYRRADSLFGAAVADVHIRVATKARDGRIVEFSQLRQAFSDSITAAGTPGGGAPGAGGVPPPPPPPPPPPEGAARAAAKPTPAQIAAENERIIARIWSLARNLSAGGQLLANGTPDYLASLARAAGCSSAVQ